MSSPRTLRPASSISVYTLATAYLTARDADDRIRAVRDPSGFLEAVERDREVVTLGKRVAIEIALRELGRAESGLKVP